MNKLTTDTKAEAYAHNITQSLPQGVAYPREGATNRDSILGAVAREFALVDDEAERMRDEGNPRTATAMLPDWEKQLGLPECEHQKGGTLQERRDRAHEKKTRIGTLNPRALEEQALALGYIIEIIERRPFIGGLSRGGDRISGPHTCRLWWTIKVKNTRVTRFRGGQSTGGERVTTFTAADPLICLFNRINHAHLKLTFSYDEGA